MATTCSGVLPGQNTASGPARAQRPVVIDLGEAEILERQRGQPGQRGVHAQPTALHLVEHPPQGVPIHLARRLRPSRRLALPDWKPARSTAT